MKTRVSFAAICATLAIVSNAKAATYFDSTGEGGILASNPHLDISSVEVNNTSTALSFKINLLGDPVATDWGKYIICLDTAVGGDPAGNGWGRPFGMSSGMDYFVGSWVDSGNGAEIRNWAGASWNLQSATYSSNPDLLGVTKNSSSVTLTFNFGGLGLGPGSTFYFDVFSSSGGGTDSAIDAAANPGVSVANWGDYYNTQGLVNSYTIPQVPEPTASALGALGLGILGLIRFRRR